MINKTIKLRTGNTVVILDKVITNHNGTSVTNYLVKKIDDSEIFLVFPSDIIKVVNVTSDE